MEQKKRRRYTFFSVFCLLFTIWLAILGQFKEEPVFDVVLPDSPPTVQTAMEDGNFTWDQTGDLYNLQIENTGDISIDAHVKYGFPWPGYILTIGPGETWELAVENAHHRPHTITFKNEEGTPCGTVEVWSIQ